MPETNPATDPAMDGEAGFARLGAHPALLHAIAAKGYDRPTPVQEAVLSPALIERDLLVSSRTGSGKTIAFGLAMAAQLLPPAELGEARIRRTDAPLALIIAPTRELALQVAQELAWL
ncbi:MAG TPA: DEAD/DEAH box helicase, partial [Myxococcales bacterium]|nr:DEAD/DEAH box helicase [Myxococcales bacterium]